MKTILALGFTLILSLSLTTYFIDKGLSNEQDKYKPYVGETVIIGKDTSQIIDYSTLNENFTLSNGKKVSYEFVKKQLKN